MEQNVIGGQSSPKSIPKKSTLIIAAVLFIGIILSGVLYMTHITGQRGTRKTMVIIRAADGTTEDELFFTTMNVNKVVVAKNVVFNKTSYEVSRLLSEDYPPMTVSDCTLHGLYEPKKCKADNGKSYWITITDDNELVKKKSSK